MTNNDLLEILPAIKRFLGPGMDFYRIDKNNPYGYWHILVHLADSAALVAQAEWTLSQIGNPHKGGHHDFMSDIKDKPKAGFLLRKGAKNKEYPRNPEYYDWHGENFPLTFKGLRDGLRKAEAAKEDVSFDSVVLRIRWQSCLIGKDHVFYVNEAFVDFTRKG